MANRRFEMHQLRQVLVRMRMGESNRAIADAKLAGRNKAKEIRAIAEQHGWLSPDRELPGDEVLAEHFEIKVQQKANPSLIAPYHEKVKDWMGQGLQGTTIYQALINKYGFTGSYSSLRRYLAKLAEAAPKLTTVLTFMPGEAAQVDFGAGPRIVDISTGELRKTWFFVMTLAWSRHMYVELVWDQSVETWLGCHRRAFEWFNGVPARVVIDNLKSAITKASYHDPEVQRAYADCAEGYGFLIEPCPVRDPQKKGRVESNVKYVKNAFAPLRDFKSLADANAQLREWVMSTAGNRAHGTTREQPLKRFADTEKHLLKPLPEVPPELASWHQHKVHGDCHVQFEKCRYSVPFKHVAQTVWLKASETTIRIYLSHELVAIHARNPPGGRATVKEHLPPNALAYSMQDPQWCLSQASEIGAHCRTVIERLFRDKVMYYLRAAQGIVGFKKRYGAARVNAACHRALLFDNVRYNAIKQILEKGLDQEASEEACFDGLAQSYTGAGRFTRDPSTLLSH